MSDPINKKDSPLQKQEHKVDPVWMAKWREALKSREQQGGEHREPRIVNSEQQVVRSGQEGGAKSQSWLERWQAKKMIEGGNEREQEKQALLAMGENITASQEVGGIVQRKSIKDFLRMEEGERRTENKEQLTVNSDQQVVNSEDGEERKEPLNNERSEELEELKNDQLPSLNNQQEREEPRKKSFWRVRAEVSSKERVDRPGLFLGLAIVFGVLSFLSVLALLLERFWVNYTLDQQVLLVTTIFGIVITYGFYQMKVWLPPFFLFTLVLGVGQDLLFFYLELTIFSVLGFFVSFAIQGMIMLYLVYKRDLFRY